LKTVVIGEAPRSGKSLLAHSIYDSIKTSVTHLDMLCGCAHKSFQDSFQDHEDPDEIFGLIDDYQDFLIRVIKNSGHEFDYVRVFEEYLSQHLSVQPNYQKVLIIKNTSE
jgi:hypothetical protein